MKFDQYAIAPEIKKSLAELGYRRPTDIQYKAIPSIMKGEDVLAIAQTGTGKTAAFAIPIIEKIHQWKRSALDEKIDIAALVMVPTRELAIQIAQVFEQIAQYTTVRTLCLYGGVEQDGQKTELLKGVDVVVATPGRMFDLLYQKVINLNYVKILVLDEADRMLDLGFYKDIEDVKRFLPRQHQTLYFSATINNEVKQQAYSLVTNPIRIQISPQNSVAKNVSHSVTMMTMDEKRAFLERLIKEHPEDKIIAFVRTKVRAERLLLAMNRVGIKGLSLHGDKNQTEREQALADFNANECKLLVATDLSARGVHIDNVAYVINYDLPEDPENYIHRVGRTGRGNKRGNALSFCSPEEEPLLKMIEDYLDLPISRMLIDKVTFDMILAVSEETFNWRDLVKEEEVRRSQLPKKKNKKK